MNISPSRPPYEAGACDAGGFLRTGSSKAEEKELLANKETVVESALQPWLYQSSRSGHFLTSRVRSHPWAARRNQFSIGSGEQRVHSSQQSLQHPLPSSLDATDRPSQRSNSAPNASECATFTRLVVSSDQKFCERWKTCLTAGQQIGHDITNR